MTTLAMRLTLIDDIAQAVTAGARQANACAIIGLNTRTLQRWKQDKIQGDSRPLRPQYPLNKLSEEERLAILNIANCPEFGHLPPTQVVPKLADKQIYIASESTFYRVLRQAGQLTHRRKERPAHTRTKPKALCANGPNQLYSWDITYLPSRIRGIYFYLYLFIDIFSRKMVGWQVYEQESSELASEVLKDICFREQIGPHQLVLHSDNGSPMKGASMLATLHSLNVASSFSRPAVSNDNPFSESIFKTLKYRPNYPKTPFNDVVAARHWVEEFTQWYNNEHYHSGIGFVSPSQRHANQDEAILNRRKDVYAEAKLKNPHRWSGATRAWNYRETVHLNPEKTEERGHVIIKQKPLKKAA